MQLMTTIRRKQVRIIFHLNYLLCTGYVEKLVRHPPRLNSTLPNTVHHYTGATHQSPLHITLHKRKSQPKSQAAHREKGQASTQATQDTHYYVPTIYTVFHGNKLLKG